MIKGKPLIVLINGGSASASEIGSSRRRRSGADDHPARRRRWRAAADHGSVLHAVGTLEIASRRLHCAGFYVEYVAPLSALPLIADITVQAAQNSFARAGVTFVWSMLSIFAL
jgi:hypothetical protein